MGKQSILRFPRMRAGAVAGNEQTSKTPTGDSGDSTSTNRDPKIATPSTSVEAAGERAFLNLLRDAENKSQTENPAETNPPIAAPSDERRPADETIEEQDSRAEELVRALWRRSELPKARTGSAESVREGSVSSSQCLDTLTETRAQQPTSDASAVSVIAAGNFAPRPKRAWGVAIAVVILGVCAGIAVPLFSSLDTRKEAFTEPLDGTGAVPPLSMPAPALIPPPAAEESAAQLRPEDTRAVERATEQENRVLPFASSQAVPGGAQPPNEEGVAATDDSLSIALMKEAPVDLPSSPERDGAARDVIASQPLAQPIPSSSENPELPRQEPLQEPAATENVAFEAPISPANVIAASVSENSPPVGQLSEPANSMAAPVVAQATAPAQTERPAIDSTQAAVMMRRADALAAIGDLSGARLFYEHLALAGNHQATLALARSYDANWLRQLGVVGVSPDPKRADYWYERASALIDKGQASQAPQAKP